MYLDHVRRYVNIKELLAGSLHTNSGAEQLVILNTRNPLETHGPPSPPLPSPFPPRQPPRPRPFDPCRDPVSPPRRPGYNARQIDDSIDYQRIHRATSLQPRVGAGDQFKRIMEIDQTPRISWRKSSMLRPRLEFAREINRVSFGRGIRISEQTTHTCELCSGGRNQMNCNGLQI